MPCPNNVMNEKDCTCPTVDCVNHGQCCACVSNHINNKDKLPFCLRPKFEVAAAEPKKV